MRDPVTAFWVIAITLMFPGFVLMWAREHVRTQNERWEQEMREWRRVYELRRRLRQLHGER